jgi:hypothetical protein
VNVKTGGYDMVTIPNTLEMEMDEVEDRGVLV